MFSQTFEKQFKTRAKIGRKFNSTKFFSSVFLSTGVAEATFAFSGNNPFFMLLLTDYERSPAKKFAANLTNLGGIISTPVDFSVLNAVSIFFNFFLRYY